MKQDQYESLHHASVPLRAYSLFPSGLCKLGLCFQVVPCGVWYWLQVTTCNLQGSGWHLEVGPVFIPQHQQDGELGIKKTGPVLPRKCVVVLINPQGWFLARYPRLPLGKVWSACLLLPQVPFFKCNSSTMLKGHGGKMESRLAWATW